MNITGKHPTTLLFTHEGTLVDGEASGDLEVQLPHVVQSIRDKYRAVYELMAVEQFYNETDGEDTVDRQEIKLFYGSDATWGSGLSGHLRSLNNLIFNGVIGGSTQKYRLKSSLREGSGNGYLLGTEKLRWIYYLHDFDELSTNTFRVYLKLLLKKRLVPLTTYVQLAQSQKTQ